MRSRLTRLADEFEDLLRDVCRASGPAWCVAHRRSDQIAELARLEQSVRHSVRNSVVGDNFDASGRTSRLNASARRRGIVAERIISPRTAAAFTLVPLTAMYANRLVVAPVRSTMILTDQSVLTFAGPMGEDEFTTMWRSRSPEVVDAAVQLTDAQLAEGEPLELLPVNDVNERRLHVLIGVLQGQTDTAIAHALAISMRTVERDIAALKELAGVASRVELMPAGGYDSSRRL